MSAEIIEARYTDNLPASIVQTMTAMTLPQARERRDTMVNFVREILKEGTDFGVIPGTGKDGKGKKTLLKPGAEKLGTFFGLVPKFEIVEKVVDWTGRDYNGEPFFYFHYRCLLYRDGVVIAEAEGSANSWEKKHRYRDAQRKCPKCGAETIFNQRDKGGFFCWKSKGGCGSEFVANAPEIVSQVAGRIPNPDVADVVNTLQKQAQKRAFVAAILIGVNASEFFTQDLEDFADTQSYASQEPAPEPQAPVQETQEEAKTVTEWREDLKARAFDLGYDKAFLPLAKSLYGKEPKSWTVEILKALYELPDEAWQRSIAALAPVPPADTETFNAKYAENHTVKEDAAPVPPQPLTPEQDKAFTGWFEKYPVDSMKLSEIIGREVACNEIGFGTLTDAELVNVNNFLSTGTMPRKLEVVEGGKK